MQLDLSYRASFVGGTIFGVLPNIHTEDITVTCIMAAIGAVVSFFVSYLLRKLFSDSNKINK